MIRTFWVVALLALVSGPVWAREPDAKVRLWPGNPPGAVPSGPEKIVENRPRPFDQWTGITEPELAVFLPSGGGALRTAVLVCPGGGLQRLAYEHEGLEVAEALSARGMAAFVLKYRVPAPVEAGLADAQRAMGVIRSRATEWRVDPEAVGVLGFSAGGEIAVWLATHFETRGYEPVDEADKMSCRPDFAGIVYPGGLISGRDRTLKEALRSNLGKETPPMFLVHAFDDGIENSLQLMAALKRARVPSELHVFQHGVHGFGVRGSGLPVAEWPERFERWLSIQGFTDKSYVREHARRLAAAASGPLPSLVSAAPESTLDDAYAAQRRVVRKALQAGEMIGGFKGAAASKAAQDAMGLSGPMAGVLLRSGRLNAGTEPTVIENHPGTMLETEIGYQLGVEIAYAIETDAQMKSAVQWVMPVIEVPRAAPSAGGPADPRDQVAANIGSDRFVVGARRAPGFLDLDALPIRLTRGESVLHETRGGTAAGGQFSNLRKIVNQLVHQGYTIRPGDVILCGALGGIHRAEAGLHVAEFGELGRIEFEVR